MVFRKVRPFEFRNETSAERELRRERSSIAALPTASIRQSCSLALRYSLELGNAEARLAAGSGFAVTAGRALRSSLAPTPAADVVSQSHPLR